MQIVFATNNAHKLSEIRAILGNQIEILSLQDIGCNVDIPETGKTLEENALQKARYVWEHYHLPCFADDTGLEVEALGGAPGVYSARYAAMNGDPQQPAAMNGDPQQPAAMNGDPQQQAAMNGDPQQQAAMNGDPQQHAAMNGDPQGHVLSHDSEANMNRLLRELQGKENRKARFRTVIALIEKKDVCPCGCTSIKREHLFEGIVEGEIMQERSGAEGFGYDPIFRPEGFDKTFAEMSADEKNSISHRGRATRKLCEYLVGDQQN